MTWELKKKTSEDFEDTILIEGLPGIGNVGKIAADLLLQEFDSEVVAEFFSYSMPNAVFVKEDNLVQLPTIEVKHFNHDGQDYLFLVGDVQPTETEVSYEFADKVLDYAESQGCREIITLGGIGLKNVPDEISVYTTANDEDLLEELGEAGANVNTHGKVGPLMGISGLLIGLGKERGLKGASLLGETMAHPMYIGLKGSRQIINVLNNRYDFGVSTEDLDEEIQNMEDDLKQNLQDVNKIQSAEGHPEMNYIG